MYQSLFKTKNVSIHYVQKYTGQDIVWCPGGDQTGEELEEQFDFFKKFRNTSFEPRGSGKTISYEDPPWSINTFAQDLSKLIQEVCKPPVIIIGFSKALL